uniref:Uncharacterized protein n=1 Tax=Anguilla anguilla TaxID=7936 RepID=A0A0E9VET7_ANGAN
MFLTVSRNWFAV